MLLSDSDLTVISAVSGNGSFLTGASARSVATRLQSEEGTSASVRSNFIVDSSTPHGDAIVVDRSVMKPALGWVTAHTTEGLKSGVHEWCIKIEHQGETSDGSGLMLGIVPKNFSRFDSFISQGGGWCISRAGKFYGQWRRIDNNTAVSALTFATGDKVIFELDFDNHKMTVRVGDKYVTGELSNLTTGVEVYPAVSLHYRHQHVRFEHHKVHERGARRLSWVDRGCFPSAACYLPITSAQEAASLPLPHYLFSASLCNASSSAGANGGGGGAGSNPTAGASGVEGGSDASGNAVAGPKSPTSPANNFFGGLLSGGVGSGAASPLGVGGIPTSPSASVSGGGGSGAASSPLTSSALLEVYALKMMLVARVMGTFQRLVAAGGGPSHSGGGADGNGADASSSSSGAASHLITTSIADLRKAAQYQAGSTTVQALLRALLPSAAASGAPSAGLLGSTGLMMGAGGGFMGGVGGLGSSAISASLAGDCGAVLMLQAIAHPSSATPIVLSALPLVIQFMAKGEPFALSELVPDASRSISTSTTQSIADRLYALLTPSLASVDIPKELRPRVLELLVALAVQRGTVSDAVRAVRLLFLLSDECPDARLSEQTSHWLRLVYAALKAPRQLLPFGAASAATAASAGASSAGGSNTAGDATASSPSPTAAGSGPGAASAGSVAVLGQLEQLLLPTPLIAGPTGTTPPNNGDSASPPSAAAVDDIFAYAVDDGRYGSAFSAATVPSSAEIRTGASVNTTHLYVHTSRGLRHWSPSNNNSAPIGAKKSIASARCNGGDVRLVPVSVRELGEVWQETMGASTQSASAASATVTAVPPLVKGLKWAQPSSMAVDGDFIYWSPTKANGGTDGDGTDAAASAPRPPQSSSCALIPLDQLLVVAFSRKTLRPSFVLTGDHPLLSSAIGDQQQSNVPSLQQQYGALSNACLAANAHSASGGSSSAAAAAEMFGSDGLLLDANHRASSATPSSPPNWRVRLLPVPAALSKSNGNGGFMLAYQNGPSGAVFFRRVKSPSSFSPSSKASSSPSPPMLMLFPTVPAPNHHHAVAFNASTRLTLMGAAQKVSVGGGNSDKKGGGGALLSGAAGDVAASPFSAPLPPLPSAAEFSIVRGHLTIELWCKLSGRCEPQTLLKAGDKAQQGELFIDFAVTEGAFCVRGGYRHDTRGTHIVTIPLPVGAGVAGANSAFHHVALCYDGRWRLVLNGLHEVYAKGVQQPSIERLFSAAFTVGGTFNGLLCDLRVWRGARSSHDIARDCCRALSGAEAGLCLYWPMCESEGALVYDRSPNGFHGVLRRTDVGFGGGGGVGTGGGPASTAAAAAAAAGGVVAGGSSNLAGALAAPTLVASSPTRVYLPTPCVAPSIFAFATQQQQQQHFSAAPPASYAATPRLVPNLEECSMAWDDERGLLLTSVGEVLTAHQLVIGNASPTSSAGTATIMMTASLVDTHLTHLFEPKTAEGGGDKKASSGAPLQLLCCRRDGVLAIVPPIAGKASSSDATDASDKSASSAGTPGGLTHFFFAHPLQKLRSPTASVLAAQPDWASTAQSLTLPTTAFVLLSMMESCAERFGIVRGSMGSSPITSRLFVPFVTDVSVDCLWSVVGLIRDHFRQMQVRNAPKTHNLRHAEHSAPVLCAALQLLDQQVDAAGKFKIHPSMLDLEIPEEAVVGSSGLATSSPGASLTTAAAGGPLSASSSGVMGEAVNNTNNVNTSTPQRSASIRLTSGTIHHSPTLQHQMSQSLLQVAGLSQHAPGGSDQQQQSTQRGLFPEGGDASASPSSPAPRLGQYILSTLSDLVQAAGTLDLPEDLTALTTVIISRCIPHHFALPARRAVLLLSLLRSAAASSNGSPSTPPPQQQALVATRTIVAGGATVTSTRPIAPQKTTSPPNTSANLPPPPRPSSPLPSYTALMVGLVESMASVEACVALNQPAPASVVALMMNYDGTPGSSSSATPASNATPRETLLPSAGGLSTPSAPQSGQQQQSYTLLDVVMAVLAREASHTSSVLMGLGGNGDGADAADTVGFTTTARRRLFASRFVASAAKALGTMQLVLIAGAIGKLPPIPFAAGVPPSSQQGPTGGRKDSSSPEAQAPRDVFGAVFFSALSSNTIAARRKGSLMSQRLAAAEGYVKLLMGQSMDVLQGFIHSMEQTEQQNIANTQPFAVLSQSIALSTLQVAVLSTPLYTTPETSTGALRALQALGQCVKKCGFAVKGRLTALLEAEKTLAASNAPTANLGAAVLGSACAASSPSPQSIAAAMGAASACLALLAELSGAVQGSLAALAAVMVTTPIPTIPSALRHTPIMLLDGNSSAAKSVSSSTSHSQQQLVRLSELAASEKRLPLRWQKVLASREAWRDSANAEAKVGGPLFQQAMDLVVCVAMHLSSRRTLLVKGATAAMTALPPSSLVFGDDALPPYTTEELRATMIAVRPIRRMLLPHRSNDAVIGHAILTCMALLELSNPYTPSANGTANGSNLPLSASVSAMAADDPPYGPSGWASTANLRNIMSRSSAWPSAQYIPSSTANSPSKQSPPAKSPRGVATTDGPLAAKGTSATATPVRSNANAPITFGASASDTAAVPTRTPDRNLSPTGTGGGKGFLFGASSGSNTGRYRWARSLRLYRIARLLGDLHASNEKYSLKDTIETILLPLLNPNGAHSITAAALSGEKRGTDEGAAAAGTPAGTVAASSSSIPMIVAGQLQAVRDFSAMRACGYEYIVSMLPPSSTMNGTSYDETVTTLTVLVAALERRLRIAGSEGATHSGAAAVGFHYASGMIGASLITKVQRSFYAVVRYVMASPALRHLTPSLLRSALRANDYSLFASLRISKRLVDEVSLFAPDTGLLRDESALEKLHRMTLHDRYKHVANGLSPPPVPEDAKIEPKTPKEEERTRGWRMLAVLGTSCAVATGSSPTALLSSHGHLATRMFLDDYFEALSGELDKCAEYSKNFYYPSQERVSEHIVTLCNLASSVVKLLPSGRHCRHAIVCAAQLIGIAFMPMLPSYPSNMAEICVRTAGDILAKSNPTQCQKYFAAVARSLPVPITVSDVTIAVLVGLALKCSCGVEGYHSGFSGAALVVLSQLAVIDAWREPIDRLAATLSHNVRIAAAPNMSDATRREHLLAVMVTCNAIGGFPSQTLTVGAEVLVPSNGSVPPPSAASSSTIPPIANTNANLVLARIVEVNYMNNTIITVQLPLSDGHPEVETQMQHVRSPFSVAMATSSVANVTAPCARLAGFVADTRALTGPRIEALDAALLTLSLEWASITTSPAGAAAAMYLVRLATMAVAKDSGATIRWARSGVLRRLHDNIATKSVLTPTPFNALDELSSVYLNSIFRPIRQLYPSAASAGGALNLGITSAIGGGFQGLNGADAAASAVPRSALQRMAQTMLVPTSEAPVAALAALSAKRLMPAMKAPRAREPANVLLFASHSNASLHISNDPTRAVGENGVDNGDAALTDDEDSRGKSFPSLPPITSGLSIELTLMLSDCGTHLLMTSGPSAPKCYSQLAFQHTVMSLLRRRVGGLDTGEEGEEDDGSAAPREELLSLQLRGRCIYFGIPEQGEQKGQQLVTVEPPSGGVFARVPLNTRDYDRWIHLVVLVTPSELVIFRDGELAAGVPHSRKDILTTLQTCSTVFGSNAGAKVQKERGEEGRHPALMATQPPTSPSEGLFMIGGLRLWGYALQGHLLQSINDVFRGDASLPGVSIGNSQCLSFRLQEGSGRIVVSDTGEYFGHLSGVMRWAPQKDIFQLPEPSSGGGTPTDFAELDVANQMARAAQLMEIPRRDVAAYLEALDASNGATIVMHNLLSLTTHYARRCVVLSLCALDSVAVKVALTEDSDCLDPHREALTLVTAVLPVTDMLSSVANLLRYAEQDTVQDPIALRILSDVVCRVLKSEAMSLPHDVMHDVVRRQFAAGFLILKEESEDFTVELPYCSSTLGDVVAPLLVMNGGMRSFNSDEGRHMDSVSFYADKLHKHILARAPDSSGFWSEHVVACDKWCYVRPSSSVKYSNAIFSVKARTVRHQIAASMLIAMINTVSAVALSSASKCTTNALLATQAMEWLECVFEQQVIRGLTYQFEVSRAVGATQSPSAAAIGTRRPDVLEVLTAIYRAWRHFPACQRFDQCPVRMTLEKVVATAQSALRRAWPASVGIAFGLLSPTLHAHATHVQLCLSLMVAAVECQEAWQGGSSDAGSSSGGGAFEGDCRSLLSHLSAFYAATTTMPVAGEDASSSVGTLPFTAAPNRVIIANALQQHPSSSGLSATAAINALFPTLVKVGPSAASGILASNPNPCKRRGNGALVCLSDRPCTMRSTVGIKARSGGKFYVEVRLSETITSPLSIGLVTEDFKGVGSDCAMGQCSNSWSFDGGRLCRSHKGVKTDFPIKPKWKAGDVIALRIDMEGQCSLSCLLNNKLISTFDGLDLYGGNINSGPTIVYPAISFASSNTDALDINFGACPFVFDLPVGYAPLDASGYFTVPSLTLPACVALSRYGTAVGAAMEEARIRRLGTLHRLMIGATAPAAAGDGDANGDDAMAAESFASYGPSSIKLQPQPITLPVLKRELAASSSPAAMSMSAILSAAGRKGPPTVRFYHHEARSPCMPEEVTMGPQPTLMRGNVVITSGRWYYEAVIDLEGTLCIGFVAKPFLDAVKPGGKVIVGEDPHSWVLDGTTMILRYNKTQRNLGRQRWRAGDVVGVILDCERATIGFTINGQPLRDLHDTQGRSTHLPIQASALRQGLVPILFGANCAVTMRCSAPSMEYLSGASALLVNDTCTPTAGAGEDAHPSPLLPLGCEEYAMALAAQYYEKDALVENTTSATTASNGAVSTVDLQAVIKARDALLDITEASSVHTLLDLPASRDADPVYNGSVLPNNKSTTAANSGSPSSAVVPYSPERALLYAAESFQSCLGGVMGPLSISASTMVSASSPLGYYGPSTVLVEEATSRRRSTLGGGTNNDGASTTTTSSTNVFLSTSPSATDTAPLACVLPLVAAAQSLRRVALPSYGMGLLKICLGATEETISATDVNLKLTFNRRNALASRSAKDVGKRFRSSIFGQLLSAIGEKGPNFFSRSGKLWSVVFAGEGADDVGGPYRECLTAVCEELMTGVLPLFAPTPNNHHNVGEARDKFTVSPIVASRSSSRSGGASSSSARFNTIAAYTFFGRLIGGCLRTSEPLALYLPPSFWRSLLVGASSSSSSFDPTDDIEASLEDVRYTDTLKYLLALDADPLATDEDVQEVLGDGFTTFDVLGNVVNLLPTANAIASSLPVTKRLLPLYIELYRSYRLSHEGAEAKAALAKGFYSVVPPYALAQHVTSWRALEVMVCGQPDFDVDAVMANARFENISPLDPRVRYLTAILKDFTPKQRSMFARFVSGRERLPPSMKLKIMHSAASDGAECDGHLPTASTCFYWISLPHFSSQAVMAEKLVFAITQCLDIDGDFVVREGAGGAGGGAGAVGGLAEPTVLSPVGAGGLLSGNDDDEFEDYSHLM